MPLHAVSLGGEIDVWSARSGVVHSVFASAVNLLVDDELWTVLGPGRTDSPFGIRLAPGNARLNVQAADPVNIRAGYVGIGRLVLDCRTASRWVPACWARPAPGLAARLAIAARAAQPRAWRESASMAGQVTDALRGTDTELAHAVRRTVGRGPGLTPAGDDVLVGIFALLASGAVARTGEQDATRLAGALDRVLHTTTDVSRHLLQQAARGLPGRALHELGRALMEDTPHVGLADALARALDIGATSGADACIGLVTACQATFFRTRGLAA